MTTVNLYEETVNIHQKALQNIQQLYDVLFLKLEDTKNYFEPLQANIAALNAGGITIDLKPTNYPVRTLKSGENIPSFIVQCKHPFTHVIETMVLLGWCAVPDPQIPNCAVFEKYNCRVLLELDEPF